jgi:hypothetical protein
MAIKTEEAVLTKLPSTAIPASRSAVMALEETASPLPTTRVIPVVNSLAGVQTPLVNSTQQTSFTPTSDRSATMAAQEAGVSQTQIEDVDKIEDVKEIVEPPPDDGFKKVPDDKKDGDGGWSGGAKVGSELPKAPGDKKDGDGGGTSIPPAPTGEPVVNPEVSATQAKSDALFQKAQDMTFEYNPATDPEYKLAASQLENDVAQMMVGRGGLYSSVTASALQSRLTELQVAMQKQAYEKFVTERDFTMKMASFAADREDAAWDKNFKMAQFNAELEQQKFDNAIKSAQLRIQQANASYARQAATAAKKQAEAKNNLLYGWDEYNSEVAEFTAMRDKWERLRNADAEVAAYFGVTSGKDVFSYIGELQRMQDSFTSQKAALESAAKQVMDYDDYLETVSYFQGGATDPTTQKNDQDNYYNVYMNEYVNIAKDTDFRTAYNQARADATSGRIDMKMGQENFNNLMSYLQKKAADEE